MILLFLLLHTTVALAEEAPPEPPYCADLWAAVCENHKKILPDYSEIGQQIEELKNKAGHPEKVKPAFERFKVMEKQSIIPLFDEARTRLLEAIATSGALEKGSQAQFKAILEKVKLVSLSGLPDAYLAVTAMQSKLPKNSILRQNTPEALDVVKNGRFDGLSPKEKDVLAQVLLINHLSRVQQQGCGEGISLNAMSLGKSWGIPSVFLCLDSMLKLQPLDVQTRYPILAAVFAHELGHHIDSRWFPELYTKYFSCLKDEALAERIRFNDKWSREIAADFWSASALGNMLKTRAALLEEPTDAARSRALAFLRTALNDLCHRDSDTSVHPPDEFRVRRVFSASPEIRKMLGCKPKPACGLSGRQ